MINDSKLRKRLLQFSFFILVFQTAAIMFYWYSSIWYIDMLLHFTGGFWIGLIYFFFFRVQTIDNKTILYLFLFTLILGVGWEIFEIFLDRVITFNDINYLDTFSDICFDLAGGLMAYFYFIKRVMIRGENKI